jgi:hypothetical protein
MRWPPGSDNDPALTRGGGQMPIISPDDIPVRPDGLQLDDNGRFQRAFWRAERIAWGIFAAIMLAALSGLFGGKGPVNERVLRFGAAEMALPRILRAGKAMNVVLTFPGSGPHEVSVSCDAVAGGLTAETPGRGWYGGCGSAVVESQTDGVPARLVLTLTGLRTGIAPLRLRVDAIERDVNFIILP